MRRITFKLWEEERKADLVAEEEIALYSVHLDAHAIQWREVRREQGIAIIVPRPFIVFIDGNSLKRGGGWSLFSLPTLPVAKKKICCVRLL